MIQLPQYLLWIGATLLAGYVAVLGWKLGVSRHFPFLTAYLVLSLIAELSKWVILKRCRRCGVHACLLHIRVARCGSSLPRDPCYVLMNFQQTCGL